MSKKCHKCKNMISSRHFVTCSSCSHDFDINCVNISDKRFYLMSPNRKKNWKCKECLSTSDNTNDRRLNITPDNITLRRAYNIPTKNSFQSLSEDEFDSDNLHDDTKNRSCPELNITQNSETLELKEIIKALETKLEVADSEIENLILENGQLKHKILNCDKKIKQLQSLCKTTPNIKRGRKSLNKTKLNFSHIDDTDITHSEEIEKKIISEVSQNTEQEISSPTTPTFSTQKEDTIKRIFILGGNQCSGLALRLIKSRLNTQYETYKVSSVIKPNAPCYEILNSSETKALTSDDIIIVNVGEMDKNPITLCSELAFFLKTHSEPTVIVLSLKSNKYLNETELNKMMKLYCENFKNCKFLDTSGLYTYNNDYIKNTIFKINILIDSLYYEKNYLSYKKIKLLLVAQNRKKNSCNFTNNLGNNHDNEGLHDNLFQLKKKLNQTKITNYFSNVKTKCTPNPSFFRG
jgi:hypothetical protein